MGTQTSNAFLDLAVIPREPCEGARLVVASFLIEIIRIISLMLPGNDDIMGRVLRLIEENLQELHDTLGPTFNQRLKILEIMARVMDNHDAICRML